MERKKVAVLVVNPVNGLGLFHYLEGFYEHGIAYRTYAVAASREVHTNSGVVLTTDDTVEHLKGRADEYDALVFACGDAVPVFRQHAAEAWNVDMLEVIREFAGKGKMMIGHCAAALLFEIAGVTEGKRLAVHPLAKPAIVRGSATDEPVAVDGNFFTAQCEHTLAGLLPEVLKSLQ